MQASVIISTSRGYLISPYSALTWKKRYGEEQRETNAECLSHLMPDIL